MDIMLHICSRINAPFKPEKVVKPTTSMTFLGILIDTTSMIASISADCKLSSLEELQSFKVSKNATTPNVKYFHL